MGSEDLSENIINISKELTKLENKLLDLAEDDPSDRLDRQIWEGIIRGYPVGWPRPLSRLAGHSINGSNSNVNIIPGVYGMDGDCRDTLMVIVEPSRFIYQADEFNVEMRIIKRIETAANFVSRKCPDVKYILFWAAIWDYYAWNNHKNKFTKQKAYLKPWGMDTVQIK